MADLLEQAKELFPYLQDKEILYLNTPNESDGRMLESYSPGANTLPGEGRPPEFPPDSFGIQNFSEKTRPIDVLGDYVSHEGVNNDPTLKELYRQFDKVTPVDELKKRYEHHKKNGEKRPFAQWKAKAGLPELFRGYTFDQWGADSA